jgi:hypothetical protein
MGAVDAEDAAVMGAVEQWTSRTWSSGRSGRGGNLHSHTVSHSVCVYLHSHFVCVYLHSHSVCVYLHLHSVCVYLRSHLVFVYIYIRKYKHNLHCVDINIA